MVSAEVHRTLVKSPPELWAELSDPTALARHLGELGDVRIVRTQPETYVEWAAENISGTVSIKPSGWGTKVTLSVTREFESAATEEPVADEAVSAEEPAVIEPAVDEPAAIEEPAVDEPAADEPAAVEDPVAAETHEPTAVDEPPPEPMATEAAPPAVPAEQPEPRRGFFARLFGRRRKDAPPPQDAAEELDAFAAVRHALAPETVATTHAFDPPPAGDPAPAAMLDPTPPGAPEQNDSADEAGAPPADVSAELLAAEQVAVAQVTAVLTAALDRLGAAHHRPFSRA
jgi:hypothetical protein